MLNIFRKQTVKQIDPAELDLLKKIVRWHESARILGDISEEEFRRAMQHVDQRLSELETRR